MNLSTLQRLQIGGAVRQEWYLVMAKTASEGLPQIDVLEKLRLNFKKTRHSLGPLVEILIKRLRGAGSVSRADLKTIGSELGGLVPNAEALLIQAGESSGNIAEGFMNAAAYVEAQRKLRDALLGALAKPVIYFFALIGLLLFFSFKLLPSFEKNRPRVNWPAEAKVLGFIADNVLLITGSAIGMLVGGLILLNYLSANWTGDLRDRADEFFPPFTLIAQINAATFMGSIAGFVSSGIPFSDAISKIRLGSNKYMRFQCDRMQNWIRSGRRPEQCLVSMPLINRRYHWIIDIYGMGSDASHAYKTIAKEMLDRTINTVSLVFGALLSNVMLMFLGANIMWIYFSMFAIADPK